MSRTGHPRVCRLPTDKDYYRARYYDSEAGRFLTRDPAGMAGGANRYAYAGNNPVSASDPSGRIYYFANYLPVKKTPIYCYGGGCQYSWVTSWWLARWAPWTEYRETDWACTACKHLVDYLCEAFLLGGLEDVMVACAEGCAWSVLTFVGFLACYTVCMAIYFLVDFTVCGGAAEAACHTFRLCP